MHVRASFNEGRLGFLPQVYYTNNNPLWSRRHHTDGLTHPFIHLLPTDDSITDRPTNADG